MKKIWLIAFFLFQSFCGLASVEIKTKEKIDFNCVKLNISSEFKELINPSQTINTNWHLELNTYKLFNNFNYKFVTGMSIYSGSISKLNSPLISNSVSAFSTSSFTPQIINVTKTESFNKQISFFSEINVYNGTINFLYEKDNIFAVSSNYKYLHNDSQFNISFTIGNFKITEKKWDNLPWYNDFYYNNKNTILCSNINFIYKSKKNNFNFYLNLYDSIYSYPYFSITIKDSFKINDIKFNLETSYNPFNNLTTSSGKILNSELINKLNFDKSFINDKNRIIKTGFGLSTDYNFSLNKLEIFTEIGINIIDKKNSTYISTDINYKNNITTSFCIKEKFNIKNSINTLSYNYKIESNNKVQNSHKFNYSFTKNGIIKVNTNISCNINFEKLKYKNSNYELNCSLQKNFKFCSFYIKVKI